MSKLVERIMGASKAMLDSWKPGIRADLVKGQAEALSPNSPVDRKDIEDSFNAMTNKVQTDMLNQIAGIETAHSPLSPEDSQASAIKLSAAAGATIGLVSAAGIIAEIASIGQVEKISDRLQDIVKTMGLGIALGATVKVPYKWAVDIGHNYYWANKFQPMIPPANDLIQMVVREAFIPEVVTPAPAEFSKWLGFTGFAKDWADRYWTAHWIPMSVTDAKDALRRGLIDMDKYEMLLKFADFHPMWREPLKGIAYRTWRLRDMRIGWELGILSDEQLVKRLKDYGYHPDEVENVAAVMKAYALAAEINDVRREIIADFKEGFIDEATLKDNLTAVGTPDSVAQYYVEKAIMRRERDLNKQWVKVYKASFRKDVIDENTFRGNLIDLGLDTAWVEAIVAHEKAKKGGKITYTEIG